VREFHVLHQHKIQFEVGLELFGHTLSAVEFTRTMLAASPPQKKKLARWAGTWGSKAGSR
jgi:hypothetical protein